MTRLILRSAVILVGSALLGSIAVFVLLRLLPGDIASLMLGEHASADQLAVMRAELGLDRSWIEQYVSWIVGVGRGDLGESFARGYDIFAEIRARLGVTLSIAIGAMVLSWFLALVLGTYAAMHEQRIRGGVVDLAAQLGIAIPSFWLGLVLVLFASVRMGWFPAGGYVPWTESVPGAIRSMTLPTLAVSASLAAVNIRYVRSAMIEVLNQDYIRTAMAKGQTRRRAALRHGLRNASVVLVTNGVLQLGGLLAGVVVIENVFVLPGLGRMLVGAVAGRELVVVQSLAFLILLLVLVLNFVLDIVHGVIDPRIRDAQSLLSAA
jgi:peptide/nickel transport system permease protein